MFAKVHIESWEIDRRLRELGLSRDGMLSAIKAAVALERSCTENSPPTARGFFSWQAAVVRLREEYCIKKEWVRNDSNNFSTILNRTLGIKIAVSNTDENTGNPKVYPFNRSRKGEVGRQAVSINQLLLPYEGWADTKLSSPPVNNHTWYLCIYIKDETVRAELSLPTVCEKGYFADWGERIILVSSDDDWRTALSPALDQDNGPVFKVLVTRK
jgi:hypothetical protein